MERLHKGVFGSEFMPAKNAPFGFQTGQQKFINKLTHNSGWYNKKGEKLGFGDLDVNDLRLIIAGLEPDEMFIVLSEHDSFWRFVTRVSIIGSMAATKPDEKAPGPQYVSEKAMYAFAKGIAYTINRGRDFVYMGIPFINLSSAQLLNLMTKGGEK